MRFEVPQFIEIEDKIFGPLTWKQFIYVAGGVGLAAVLFFTAPFLIFVIIGIPVAALTFLLGFYPVNNQPFSRFLESAVYYMKNTKIYFWRKKGTGVYSGSEENQAGSPSYLPPTNTGNLATLSRKLELKAIQKQN
jgi:hypothetical protein